MIAAVMPDRTTRPRTTWPADRLERAGAFLRRLRGWRADLASAGLGALSALALPPIHLLPLLLVSVPGLLVLIDAAPNARSAARRGFWFGVGHHVLGLYWITEAIMVEAADYWWFVPIAVPGLSMVLAPFIALPCAAARKIPAGWRRIAMLAGCWVLGDLARQFIGTGFPWNPWGSVWVLPGLPGTVMIQPAAWIGTPGLTLLTVLLASLPMLGRRGWLTGLAVLILWGGLGTWRLSQPTLPAPDLSVVLVQGNVPQGAKWNIERARAIFQHYLVLTRQGVARVGDGPSVVIWPESSFPGLLDQEPDARQAMMDAASPALAVLAGSVRFPDAPAGAGEVRGRPRNSLVAVQHDGAVSGVYDKWHLVPGGEYAPTWLPFAVQIVPGGGFARGAGPHTLHLPGLPAMGPFICYEAIFPAQVIDESDRPGMLVNITNDAWFGNSTGPRQHLAAVQLRAVEEGLPLVRAANTGISAVFDAHGRMVAHLGMNRAGFIGKKLSGALPPTPFSQGGLAIPLLLACLCASISMDLSPLWRKGRLP